MLSSVLVNREQPYTKPAARLVTVCIVPDAVSVDDQALGVALRTWSAFTPAVYWEASPCRCYGWVALLDAVGVDPMAASTSLQHHLHVILGGDWFVAYLEHDVGDEKRIRQILLDAAKAARLLRHLAPIRPTEFERKAALSIFRDAATSGGLRFVLQPIVDLRDNSLAGHEMLARLSLENMDNGYPTSHWIPYVVNSHEAIRLARHAILAEEKESERLPLGEYLSINLTAQNFVDSELIARLIRMPPETRKKIVLELTEWYDALEVKGLKDSIAELRNKGYRVALDDFGNRYSSLPVLRHIQFDIIKIDISVVQSSTAADDKFFRVAIEVAKETGAKVVAEGIENERILDRVRSFGVIFGQGFYLDRLAKRQYIDDFVRSDDTGDSEDCWVHQRSLAP
jgi:EAL domain-containing protein (putative c-di-GMP-specific phosphodiesterase class I)